MKMRQIIIYGLFVYIILGFFLPIIPTYTRENSIRCIKAPCPGLFVTTWSFKTFPNIIAQK